MKAAIRKRALAEGFDVVGFADARARRTDQQALAAFIKKGWHGDMDWLARDDGRRGDPQALMPTARTAIVLAVNYGPDDDPLRTLQQPDRGTISVYARGGRDYHDVLKKRLKKLGRWMTATYGGDLKVFVDTAPVMEKPLAARAGVGWSGKHSNLVSTRFGSWLFLGEIVTSLKIAPDRPQADHCGSCTRCMDVCPTAAIPEPGRLQATRCISYLSIEHKGHIDAALMANMGNRIYGCDDCLAVCPWNKFATPTPHDSLRAKSGPPPRLADLAALDDPGFRQRFAGSPIKRTGRDRFVRNVLIAIGNSGDTSLRKTALALTHDPSPLVAHAATWAANRLRREPENS